MQLQDKICDSKERIFVETNPRYGTDDKIEGGVISQLCSRNKCLGKVLRCKEAALSAYYAKIGSSILRTVAELPLR
jgi:hypothetical protein